MISCDAQCAGEQKKKKIASAYDSRLNLSKCTFLRCNDQCIDKCPMRIDLLVINWSLPFSFIYHSSLSSKISIYFTSFKVRNKKFKWVLHTVVFYSNAHDILKTCFSNQDSHKLVRSFNVVVVGFAIRKYSFRGTLKSILTSFATFLP